MYDSGDLLRKIRDLENRVDQLESFGQNIEVVPPLRKDQSGGLGVTLGIDTIQNNCYGLVTSAIEPADFFTSPKVITAISWVAGVVTVTAANHGYSIGDIVNITDVKVSVSGVAVNSEYNNYWIITKIIDANTFTYTVVNNPNPSGLPLILNSAVAYIVELGTGTVELLDNDENGRVSGSGTTAVVFNLTNATFNLGDFIQLTLDSLTGNLFAIAVPQPSLLSTGLIAINSIPNPPFTVAPAQPVPTAISLDFTLGKLTTCLLLVQMQIENSGELLQMSDLEGYNVTYAVDGGAWVPIIRYTSNYSSTILAYFGAIVPGVWDSFQPIENTMGQNILTLTSGTHGIGFGVTPINNINIPSRWPLISLNATLLIGCNNTDFWA